MVARRWRWSSSAQSHSLHNADPGFSEVTVASQTAAGNAMVVQASQIPASQPQLVASLQELLGIEASELTVAVADADAVAVEHSISRCGWQSRR